MSTEKECSVRARKRGDFYFLRVIGEGSYSKVYKCCDKLTDEVLAIKQVSKRLLLKERKEKYAFREKQVLAMLAESPFFVRLYFTFQDEESLYFGISYHPNGDLLDFIVKNHRLSPACVAFYAAELVDAILFMHSKHVIHRDLKPENVLLSENFHIRITDFGSCRILTESEAGSVDSSRRHSMVGTAQFVAPEVLQTQRVGYGCDFWSLGCVIFQMAEGHHLFTGAHEYDILQKVAACAFDVPSDVDERVADIVNRLVVRDPDARLGVNDAGRSLKMHRLFHHIRWEDLSEQTPPVPN